MLPISFATFLYGPFFLRHDYNVKKRGGGGVWGGGVRKEKGCARDWGIFDIQNCELCLMK